MQPLVSILIPCHNADRWLTETLRSAQAQTWHNIEIIVVDDGSADMSLALARTFESTTVKVISQPNQGASAARNTALRVAQGEFIQYLDADDLLSADKIETQVRSLQSQPQDMLSVTGTMHFWDGTSPDAGIYEDGRPYAVDSNAPVEWLIRLLGGDGAAGMIHPAAWLLPRSVVDRAGDWDEQLSLDDDGEYFARVVLASRGIRRSSGGMSYYRKYRDRHNLSAARSEKHLLSALRSLDLKTNHLLSHSNDRRAKQAMARSYQELAVSVYPEWKAIAEIALQGVQELGGTDVSITLGGWQIEFIKSLFGWKVARRMSTWRQRWRQVWQN